MFGNLQQTFLNLMSGQAGRGKQNPRWQDYNSNIKDLAPAQTDEAQIAQAMVDYGMGEPVPRLR